MAWGTVADGFWIGASEHNVEAYFGCRPSQDVIDNIWKIRYSEYASDIDDGLAACFPVEESE